MSAALPRDPDACRYTTDPAHLCANADGRTPPRPGTDCAAEAAAQLATLRTLDAEMERHMDALDAACDGREAGAERWREARGDAS